MSDDEKNSALQQIELAVEAARKGAASARDAAIAEIDRAKAEVSAAKGSFDALAAEMAQSKSTLDATKAQALADIEQARTVVSSAKASVDAALAEIDQAKSTIAAAKGSLETIQKTATTDLAAIGGIKNDAEKSKADLIIKSDALNAENEQIATKIADLQAKIKPLEEALSVLTKISEEAEAERVSVTEAVATISGAKDSFEELNKKAQEKHKELSSQYDALDKKIDDIKGAHEDIASFRKILFEDSEDTPSIKSTVADLHKKISEVLTQTSEQKDAANAAFEDFLKEVEQERHDLANSLVKEFTELRAALEKEIRDLLPSAGAAGLSSTYYDAKSRYAWTSSAGKLGKEQANANGRWWGKLYHWWRGFIGYNPTSLLTSLFFYALFILPVLAIVLMFYGLIKDLDPAGIAALDIKIIVIRALIALPLAAISFFGFVSLNFYRRLYEEYNHKQRVMELYASFGKVVSDSGTDEQKQKLLSVMIDTVSDRSYLAKGTVEGKNDAELLAKVNAMSNILANLLKLRQAG